jgi:HD-GYP domain-containing protein (c-di-GMP phosphodiesterase class II)
MLVGVPMSGRQRLTPAMKIALVYLAFAVVWILLSDRVLRWLAPDADAISWLQTVKGLGFVVVSAAVIFVIARRYLDRAERTTEMLEEAYEQTLAGWAGALDIRDHSTGEHTARVTALTVALAERFGIEGDDLADMRRGATLHDIGKMAVPDAVLGKVGPLTDADWALIRQHPDMARRMLLGIAFLEPALDIPWCHHEKWDGTGYPRGLAGTDIPFPARLFAVVDVYDALTSERPYREPMTSMAALARIESESGGHFDPEVVGEFVELMVERQAEGLAVEGGRL